MIARPARVRIRSRKPWVLDRRRLFGWNVRLLTRYSHYTTSAGGAPPPPGPPAGAGGGGAGPTPRAPGGAPAAAPGAAPGDPRKLVPAETTRQAGLTCAEAGRPADSDQHSRG